MLLYNIIAYAADESDRRCYMRFIYYKFNNKTKVNEKINEKKATYTDNDTSTFLQLQSSSCELMSLSNENVLTLFFCP